MRTRHVRPEVPPDRHVVPRHVRRRGDAPVGVAMPVQMGEFDGGALAVDADATHFVRAQDTVDDGGQRAAPETDECGRDVLGLHVVHQAAGHRPHLAPRPQEIEQQVHLMDTVPHRGAAALRHPAAAPGHRVVAGVAVPRGLAVRDQCAPHGPLTEQPPHVPGAGAEPMLEDDGRVRTAVPALRRLDGVEVGQGEHRRLLAPDPGPGAQRGEGLPAVQGRRGADGDQVGPLRGEHPVMIGVRVRDAGLGTELPDGVLGDVGRGHQLRLTLLGEPGERGHMTPARDGARTDDGDPDTAAVERGRGAVRGGFGPVRGGLGAGGRDAGCAHVPDQRSIGRAVGRWPARGVTRAERGDSKRFPLPGNVCGGAAAGQHPGRRNRRGHLTPGTLPRSYDQSNSSSSKGKPPWPDGPCGALRCLQHP